MTGPCGYVCDNKTSEGYCKTTACINPKVRGMLGDEITLTLNSPITDEEFDLLTDVDMENTPRIVFHTKNGKEVEYLKVVRCKYCRFHEQEQPGMVYCPATVGGWVEENWFCKGGERRSE